MPYYSIFAVMAKFSDQLGNILEMDGRPRRIVSLVPSQTELLFDLGLDEAVVGITKFCIHPGFWFRSKTRVGGTKNVDLEKVRELQPDLVIANKEENVKEQVEALKQLAPVWVSDVNNLEEAIQMISSIGEMTGTAAKASKIVEQIESSFQKLKGINPIPAAYLIWKDPYMTVGGDTFINDMMERAGFQNVFADRSRYPEIMVEDLQRCGCEVVFLSSEPYPFRQAHIEELAGFLPSKKIVLADGEMFSWYGSRLRYAPEYFEALYKKLCK